MNRQIKLAGVGGAVGAVGGTLIATSTTLPELRQAVLGIAPNIVVWVLFFVYWAVQARNAAPAKNSESTGSTALHQFLLAAALVLALLPIIPGIDDRWLPESRWLRAAGVAVQVCFALFAVSARRHLARNWSAEVRIAVNHELVRTGPYSYLRHPIYTGMLGMLLGTAISSGRLHAVASLLIMAFAYRRKIRLEEEALSGAFGDEFATYQKATWAIVPWLF